VPWRAAIAAPLRVQQWLGTPWDEFIGWAAPEAA
jgi:hypothetical protein